MGWLEKASDRAALFASSNWGIGAVAVLFSVWLVAGFVAGWAETWFYVEATACAIMLAMLFLLKRAQAKHNMAMHLKLNELLAAVHAASPKLINIEDLSERDIQRLRRQFGKLRRRADRGSRSIEEVDRA
jgi:low affinity Fe/Cu permease